MRKKRFTEEQITYGLRQAEAGTPVAEICRKLGWESASRLFTAGRRNTPGWASQNFGD